MIPLGGGLYRVSVPRSAVTGRYAVERKEDGMTEVIEEVVQAWTNPGIVPAYHYAMQEKLRAEWPVLANALDALAEEAE